MHFRRSIAACGLFLLLTCLPVKAGLIEVYSATGTSNVDANYEGIGGFLQTNYGLPDITTPSNTTQNTVLPQLERAVAQLAHNNANGLFVPQSASGIPGVNYNISGGGTGTGVWDALTNHSSGGTVTGSLPSFGSAATSVNFSYSRTGDVITYTAGGATVTSANQNYFGDINAVEFRIHSGSSDSESLTNLKYNGTSLTDISAANGNVTIELFSGISGDFTITGTLNTSGAASNGWNQQIKGLDLPAAVPEPSSLVSAVVGGIGCLIALARRRKSLIA